MKEGAILNAVITSASIGDDDHGGMSSFVFVEFEGGGCGFGGYRLFSPNDSRERGNYSGVWLWRVMQIAGVSSWNMLPGKTIRVKIGPETIAAIGHIIKDDWFDPKATFEQMRNAK